MKQMEFKSVKRVLNNFGVFFIVNSFQFFFFFLLYFLLCECKKWTFFFFFEVFFSIIIMTFLTLCTEVTAILCCYMPFSILRPKDCTHPLGLHPAGSICAMFTLFHAIF